MRDQLTPGPWLRLAALLAAGATGAVIVAAAAGQGRAHDLIALVALAPLLALAAAAWLLHSGLRRPVAVALGLLLAEVALGGVISLSGKSTALAAAHVALAALSFAATLVVAVRVRGDGRAVPGSLRDYLILTKPRIMVAASADRRLRDGCGRLPGCPTDGRFWPRWSAWRSRAAVPAR